MFLDFPKNIKDLCSSVSEERKLSYILWFSKEHKLDVTCPRNITYVSRSRRPIGLCSSGYVPRFSEEHNLLLLFFVNQGLY
jgi:hypothetical protein